MTKNEIRELLGRVLPKEGMDIVPPTPDNWRRFEKHFNVVFPHEFKCFIELMSEFSFPGDIYNIIQDGPTNGNDTMELVYQFEVDNSNWPKEFVPFFGVGNGDYYALNLDEGPHSAVYYWSHETETSSKDCDSFQEWLLNINVIVEEDAG